MKQLWQNVRADVFGHWQRVYGGLRRLASPQGGAEAWAEAWVNAAFAQAKAHSPAVFAASSQHEPERQRKFEHVCAWFAAYWPHIPAPERQNVLEALIDRLEIGLREASVGDLQVGRQIQAMAAAAHGRLRRYGPLLLGDDPAPLAAALAEHGVAAELAERLREPLPRPKV